ncbi:MAG: hypothetical protein GY903_29295 [Fuerstiella sp.]|nr:hypothetical protein [Fuerstiella sp.]MCP4783923.1 hypothetical protein [Fuerstiella sp.]MCP4858593.1 hypothetical protein [Fuerstiella sp.]
MQTEHIAPRAVFDRVFRVGEKSASTADEYDYDLVHSSVSFKARHLGIELIVEFPCVPSWGAWYLRVGLPILIRHTDRIR